MNYAQKAIMLLLGIFLLLGLLLFFVYRPKSLQLGRIIKQDKKLAGEISESYLKKAQLPEAKKEIELIRGKLEHLEIQYPKTIEPVYQAVTTAARKVGFEILKKETVERPISDDKISAVKELDIKIQARCPYRVLGEFLQEVSNLPVIVSISSLNVLRDEDSAPEPANVPELEVRLGITMYLAREEGR